MWERGRSTFMAVNRKHWRMIGGLWVESPTLLSSVWRTIVYNIGIMGSFLASAVITQLSL